MLGMPALTDALSQGSKRADIDKYITGVVFPVVAQYEDARASYEKGDRDDVEGRAALLLTLAILLEHDIALENDLLSKDPRIAASYRRLRSDLAMRCVSEYEKIAIMAGLE